MSRQVLGALLHLVEQPHVLDCDYRLVGEGGYQLDLLFGEWLNLRACRMMTPIIASSRSSGTPRTVRCLPTFCHSRCLNSGSDNTSGTWMLVRSSATRPMTELRSMATGWLARYWMCAASHPISRHQLTSIFDDLGNERIFDRTQPRGGLNDCVEHRLQIGRRAADDVEYIAGGGLVL